MKRLLYNLLPSSLKEKIKLKYYNFKNLKYSFAVKDVFYITREKNTWEVVTTMPLYFIVKDIDRYEKYYEIKTNDIVIDAGANEGALSVVYSQKTKHDGKVFAFEPDSKNIKILKQNVSLNANSNNIEIIEHALWSNNEIIDFYEAGTVASSIFYEDKESKKVKIKATSIDKFMIDKKINRLNFIKMDIEGAEIEALKGTIETIKKYKPNFAIASYHIVNGKPTYIGVEKFFKEIDYPFKTEFYDDGEIMTYAGNSVKQ
ncbi:FkbM family methyltransferase [Flavobacteriaceae bacterium S0862]|nr:FkbM family methyltransferase [Flavobacteriaceae bacterium S0862]